MTISRDLYKHDVDFAALAVKSPAFNKHLKPNGQLDFSNPDAVKQLTKSLLENDFGIAIELPDDRLCPPVILCLNFNLKGQKYNYILWIQDLLDTTSSDYTDRYDADREVVGLDVIDFTICNPPFYISASELVSSAAAKSRPPYSACTGAEIEMVTPGGEVAFISRMIDESLALKERCQWYTSMVGKLSSLEQIVSRLKIKGVTNWAVITLEQGGKTRRWAVGWSWGLMRPKQDVARGTSSVPKHLLPFPSEFKFNVDGRSLEELIVRLNVTVGSLGLKWKYRSELYSGIGFADSNVWSRAARREIQKNGNYESRETQSIGDAALGFRVDLRPGQEKNEEVEVKVRWLQGVEEVLFESFCGMLKRQLSS
ncbi:MAG: hypothetical protein Q9190_001897 [Brigantiaea leucoxantha]